jgi:hypothetical protein
MIHGRGSSHIETLNGPGRCVRPPIEEALPDEGPIPVFGNDGLRRTRSGVPAPVISEMPESSSAGRPCHVLRYGRMVALLFIGRND